MNEDLRELLYPLGFLSGVAFGGRFLLQWMKSEIEKKSVITPLFWKLSLAGNVMLFVHAFIQVQYHVCIIQACNAVISWRNLNLMADPKRRVHYFTVFFLMGGVMLLTTTAFSLQEGEWFRIPQTGWLTTASPIVPFWHYVGFVGIFLFSLRFWVQWLSAEKYQISFLGLPFWWLSLTGGLIQLAYFARIFDLVNIIGPAMGIIPCLRNLMLIHKTQKNVQKST